MFRQLLTCCALFLVCTCTSTASAVDLTDRDPVVSSSGFLEFHPDVRHRLIGLRHLKSGHPERAFAPFIRAARYADKGSQAMIAEMYWSGRGVVRDRPRAYAWMDLAAERGYPDLLALREHYWLNLNAAEREQALVIGDHVYADFGDTVAQPRLARMLARGKRQATGSRTGFVAFLTVRIYTRAGEIEMSGSRYYHDLYWKPETYFAWQDRIWDRVHRGRVQVGELGNL